MKTVGFIGCGNMGSAIIKSVSVSSSYSIYTYDTNKELSQKIANEYKITHSSSIEELLFHSEIIILAVKPQVLPSLYEILSTYSDKFFISIAAGVTLQTLGDNLKNHNIVRLMPNMAASVGKSVTAFAHLPGCDHAFLQEALTIAQSFGDVHQLEESLFAPFIGISGSGIAMMFSLFHNMAQGAVYSGLGYQTALSIICDTARSAAELIKESNEHPSSLITKVCSPGGTTIEMMKSLSDGAFDSTVMDGVISASEKSAYLEAK